MPKTSDLEYAYETLKEDYESHMRTCGTLPESNIQVTVQQESEQIFTEVGYQSLRVPTYQPTYTVSFIKGGKKYTFETDRMTIESQR